MSSFFGKFLTILGLKRREANVLVVGLDNSGKSTILNYLKRKEDQLEEIVPTVGYTVERLNGIQSNRSGINLTAFDMSGQGRYRNLWEHYYDNVEGIIFVVDSTDALRLVVAKDELEMLLKHQNINKKQSKSKQNFGDDFDYDDEDEDDEDDDDVGDDDVFEDNDQAGAGQGEEVDDGQEKEMEQQQQLKQMDQDHHPDQQHRNKFSKAISSSGKKKSLKIRNDQSSNGSMIKSAEQQPAEMATTTGDKKPIIPILFFANKMDLKESIPTTKICQTLGLHKLPHKQWHVQASNALTGEGIQEGIDWFLMQIANNKKNQQQQPQQPQQSDVKTTSSNSFINLKKSSNN